MQHAVGQSGPVEVGLRPAEAADRDFLISLYASTREAELQLFGWGKAQCDAFINMQFNAQSQHYQGCFPDAEHQIVCSDEKPIGRLLVDWSKPDVLLIDIALLPDFRGSGIGGRLIQELLDEADKQGRAVKLHVMKNNPAGRLYHRLGFSVTGDDSLYFEMVHPAPASASERTS